MDHEKRSTLWVEASLLLAVLFLGTNPVAVKYAVAEIPPLPFVALRFTAAGLLALGVAWLLGVAGGIGRKDLLSLAGVGIVGVGMNNVFFTLGVSQTTASNTALIYAAVPVWGMILGSFLGLEQPTRKGILGVAFAFLGVGVIVYGGLGASGTSLTGDLLAVGATVCWSAYAVFSLPLLRRLQPLTVAAYTMLFGGLAAAIPAVPFFGRVEWTDVGGGVWISMLYSTVFVAAFGFAAWQRGISRIGANRVLVYQYLITFTGVSASILLLGEDFGIEKLFGGAILLGGVYLARRQ
ncbi:MAG: DMT family transporter [Rubrobacteraceae bacterium]|jgi:drug/metabolite transporter (DMT)-like permease|nr:DMT family transporter [Actinomycetota bacterium]